MLACKTPSIVAAASIAAALVAAPLQAEPPQQPVTILGHPEPPLTQIVQIDDLALATDAGRSALMHRVGVAVGQVCPEFDYAHAALNYDVQDCRTFAWTGARPQMRKAIDAAKSGQAVAMAIEVTGAGS